MPHATAPHHTAAVVHAFGPKFVVESIAPLRQYQCFVRRSEEKPPLWWSAGAAEIAATAHKSFSTPPLFSKPPQLSPARPSSSRPLPSSPAAPSSPTTTPLTPTQVRMGMSYNIELILILCSSFGGALLLYIAVVYCQAKLRAPVLAHTDQRDADLGRSGLATFRSADASLSFPPRRPHRTCGPCDAVRPCAGHEKPVSVGERNPRR